MHYSTFATTSPGMLLSTTVSLTNLRIQTAWKLLPWIKQNKKFYFYMFEPRSTFPVCHVMIAIRRLKGWMTTWVLHIFKISNSKSAHSLSKIQRYLQIHRPFVLKRNISSNLNPEQTYILENLTVKLLLFLKLKVWCSQVRCLHQMTDKGCQNIDYLVNR